MVTKANETHPNVIDGMQGVSKLVKNKPIPIVCESLRTPDYTFACSLPIKNIRCELEDLQGEATVFGKVKRIIRKGSKYELFSLLPAFSSKLPSISQKEKSKIQREMQEQGLAEIIYGPAIVLSPLAVYQ
mgnify:CR=1 FL=1